MKNLILIGMPGAGKSTVGVVLAKRLGYRFVDSDLVIQEHYGKLLHELIEENGPEGFWQIEDEVNATIKCTKTVIATGGSAIYGENAMKHFHKTGTIVYLKLPYEEIRERLGDLHARGVTVREGQSLLDLYEERSPLYERQADLTIECEGKQLREIVVEICERLEEAEKTKSTSAKDASAKGASAKDASARGASAKDTSAKDASAKDASAKDASGKDASAKGASAKDAKGARKEASPGAAAGTGKPRREVLKDKDIREPLFLFLEETYGKIRIIEEKTMGKSRADIVMVVPDALYGIEIKSDADTYVRLADQVKDYDQYFDYNVVVVGTSHGEHVPDHVPPYWGIITVEIVDGAFDFYVLRKPLPNPKVKWKRKLELLWRPELAQLQEWNEMPKYKILSKANVTAKILERVPEKIPEELLRRQVSEILFERDYSKVQEVLSEYRKGEIQKQLEKETDPEKRKELLEKEKRAKAAAKNLPKRSKRRYRRRRV